LELDLEFVRVVLHRDFLKYSESFHAVKDWRLFPQEICPSNDVLKRKRTNLFADFLLIPRIPKYRVDP